MCNILSKANAPGAFSLFGIRLIKSMAFLLLFMLVSSFNSNQKDEIDALYQAAHNRLSKQGALFLKNHFVYHKEPCLSIAVAGGWVWRCTHSDGFTTYNCFRKCRGTIEAARLFLGLNTDEDCDSFTMVNGKRKRFATQNKPHKL